MVAACVAHKASAVAPSLFVGSRMPVSQLRCWPSPATPSAHNSPAQSQPWSSLSCEQQQAAGRTLKRRPLRLLTCATSLGPLVPHALLHRLAGAREAHRRPRRARARAAPRARRLPLGCPATTPRPPPHPRPPPQSCRSCRARQVCRLRGRRRRGRRAPGGPPAAGLCAPRSGAAARARGRTAARGAGCAARGSARRPSRRPARAPARVPHNPRLKACLAPRLQQDALAARDCTPH